MLLFVLSLLSFGSRLPLSAQELHPELTVPADEASEQPAAQSSAEKLPGPVTLFGNWRVRSEAWDWFQPTSGENSYAYVHWLARTGLMQSRPGFDWLIEGAQDGIVGLPANPNGPGVQGALGQGGTYLTANSNSRNNFSAFIKQAYLTGKFSHNSKLTVGRFVFNDGLEVKPRDPSLAQLVTSRISQRLLGETPFAAVLRSFDGARWTSDSPRSNVTLLAVRPTQGAYQINAMGELNIDVFYGSYTRQTNRPGSDSLLRIFGMGYLDERAGVVPVDNRSLAARSSTPNHLHIGTYGANYVHVLHTQHSGQFDLVLWGALQNGSWGPLKQRAGAFAGELGWQPPVLRTIRPWFNAGYYFGSGDSNPNDDRHGTFFQALPTARQYARFPIYDMENSQDYYGSMNFRLPHTIVIRSDWHSVRLADPADLWYSGGGAYSLTGFGYTGRAAGGARSLVNVADASFDAPMGHGFGVTLYYGYALGKSVISTIYPAGQSAQFGYIETTFRF